MKKNYFTLILSVFVLLAWSQEYQNMIAKGTFTVQEIQTVAEDYFAKSGTGRGTGYKTYKRWEYQALRTMTIDGYLPSQSFYFNELEHYNDYLNQNDFHATRSTVGDWEQMGPFEWNATSGWNPGVGRVTSFAVDPLNQQHIIIGAETGGVWKTTNEGATWTPLTDNMSDLRVYAITMDPNNSDVYYWGGVGSIFKSTNAGATWDLHSDQLNGVINKILINPDDTNQMYCSIANGGVFRSTDGGTNWTIIHESSSAGFDIEFKPGDTNTIYASGNQFFKSVDGGQTFTTASGLDLWSQEYVSGTNNWTTSGSNQNSTVTPKTGNSMALLYVSNFSDPVTNLVSPALNLSGSTAPELKFSYTNVQWDGDIDELRIFYKTSDGGEWQQIAEYTNESTTWQDITLSLPNPSSEYYVAFQGLADYGRGLTLDDISVEDSALGVVFEDGFESAPNQFGGGPKMIGVSPANPNKVYILEAAGGLFGGFHSSDDQGENFVKLDHTGMNYFGYSSQADDGFGQAPRDMDIVVHPNDANNVHIAGVLTWRSTDGGANFNITSQWTPGLAQNQNIGYNHADVDIMQFVGDRLYTGTDGGIFVANDPTTINTNLYTDLTSGLGIRQFYKIGISQSDPVIVSGGSQDNGTSVLNSDGIWRDWLGADGMESFIDKNDNTILYGTSQNGTLYKSLNSGQSLVGITQPATGGNWVTPFEQDPITPNTIYVGFNRVYASSNGGASWNTISQNLGGNLNEMKIAPSNNNVMYASRQNSLYKTNDAGATNWNVIAIPGAGFITSIAIHPTDENKVAISSNGASKVHVTTDGGITWESYLGDLPNFSARALVWQDNGKDGLYLGMNYGIYYRDNTTNGNWLPFSNQLPNVNISELEINYVDGKIYASSYGRGLWRSDLFETLGVNEFELEGITLYPNPAKSEINLQWSQSDEVSLRMYNSQGKLLYFKPQQSLTNTYTIDVSTMASGIYFLRINNQQGVLTRKVIID